MKFNLNITDMSAEEFATVFASINIPNKITIEPTLVTKAESEVTEASDETINFDVDKLPWDARIHSSNHKINSDGRWQRRRGVSDVEFNKVKNELLGVQEPVATFIEPNAPISTPVVAPAPVEPHVIPMTVAPVVAPAPEELAKVPPYAAYTPYAPTPVTPEPVAPTPATAPVTPTPVIDSNVLFQTIVEKVKNGFTQQKIAPNDLHELVARTNTQFGTACHDVTGFKDNIPALQFIIDDLTVRGF